MFSDLLFNIKTKNNNFYKKRPSLQDFPYRRLNDEAMKYKTKLKTQMTSRLNLCPVKLSLVWDIFLETCHGNDRVKHREKS